MDYPEQYFRIIYKIVRKQNEMLLREISVRENISLSELRDFFLPKSTAFTNWVQNSVQVE
jgi:hypothetical protein